MFDEQVPFADGAPDTLWNHLKHAFETQESQLGPHGGYTSGATGDWSILLSGGSYTTSLTKNWGGPGYVPVPAFQ